MPRKAEEVAEPKSTNQGVCVKCRRQLPASSFAADITGQMGAWCAVCRAECAHKWGVDPDLVEWVRCFYVLDQNLKKEAETVLQARISMGQAKLADMAGLRSKIEGRDRLRYSRIPERVRTVMQEYRAAFFYGIGMDPPDIVTEFPAAARG